MWNVCTRIEMSKQGGITMDDEVGIAKALLKALSEDIALNLLSESERSLRDLLRK